MTLVQTRWFGVPIVLFLVLFAGSSWAQTPTITSLSATSGVTGTVVVVHGTNFGTSQGGSSVSFNGVPGVPNPWTATAITVPVPALATTGLVTVKVGVATSNGITFTVIPSITSLNPFSGPIGAVVEVDGTGFENTTGGLTFNTVAAVPTFWSNTKIICEVPATATNGPVVVTVGGSSSAPVTFTVATGGTISGTISNESTGAPIAGATVGAYLGSTLQSSATSAANGTYSLTNLPPTLYSLQVSAPSFIPVTLPSVTVVAGGAISQSVSLSSPSIQLLNPASGAVGTVVTVSGANFGLTQAAGSTLTFHGVLATPTLWINNSITVPVPAGTATGAGPVVVSVGGAISNATTFTVGAGKFIGTVTQSSNGAVVSGASVKAFKAGVAKNTGTTAGTGVYTLSSVVPGTYDLVISATGLGTAILPNVVAVAGTTTTTNISLSSTPGSITGTITLSDGVTAVNAATVTAYQSAEVAGTSTSNATGVFTIASISPGAYRVTAIKSGLNGQTNNAVNVTSGSASTVNLSLPSPTTVTYVYDEASRLVGVVNSSNNAAVYNYDAAGNVLSILQNPATQVSISEFTPNSGTVGSTVTIYGTGFSTTIANDKIKFNNVAATVTSATKTQIVATVPASAITGTISVNVTSPVGSATSGSVFTVTTSNGLPTITSFTPSIAAPGTPVTIAGTNFDSVAANDRLAVNVTKTLASTATAQSITTTLPGVLTTGHVAVTTTVGSSGATANYLFVPPSGYTTSQVGYTGQTTLGGQATVTLNTANTIGMVALDLGAGQALWITTTSHFSSNVTYKIYDPYGNIIGTGLIAPATTYVSTVHHVSTAGTCVILIDPGNQTGNLVLGPVAIPADTLAAIIPDGPAVNVATTVLGQNVFLRFSGFIGERINLLTSNVSSSLNLAPFGITNPDGTTVMSGYVQPATGWYWNTGLLTLTQTGDYTIYLSPGSQGTGGVTFALSTVAADITGQIIVGGSPVTTATTAAFQSSYFTFNGTAGQRINWFISNVTGTASTAPLGITGPNGTVFSGFSQLIAGWYWNTGVLTLPASGVYTIFLKPSSYGSFGWTTGISGATFALTTVPADISGPIVLDGSPIATATTAPFQSAFLTFSGSQSQVLYLKITNTVGPAPSFPLGILGPSGTTVFAGTALTSTGWQWESGPLTLNGGAGSYKIYLAPAAGSNGTTTQTFGGTFAIKSVP